MISLRHHVTPLGSPTPTRRRPSERALLSSGRRGETALIHGLQHQDPNVREACAHLLARCGTPRAIPALITTLRDQSVFVRQDALWAIEAIAGYRPGCLTDWLSVVSGHPAQVPTRVAKWWQANRSFLEGNGNVCGPERSVVQRRPKRTSEA